MRPMTTPPAALAPVVKGLHHVAIVVESSGREGAGLVRSVELQDPRTGAVFELGRPLVGNHLAAGVEHPQAREVVVGERR